MSEGLSARDNAILNCIFNPNLPLEEAAAVPDEIKGNLVELVPLTDVSVFKKLIDVADEESLSAHQEITKKMEMEAVQLAEHGELTEALNIIGKAIEIAPNRPSLYNNRAHILQFLQNFGEALEDVTKAIELCTSSHKKTLSVAHCQRGILHRKFERTDLAKLDFEISAKLGNKLARKQLVELNPYAALCNQMLRQVMDKLK